MVHEDHSAPIVCLNTLYCVGSRNESPDKTGFAHLFEHLMFGGSKHIESFDQPLQFVGGDNNAFTNTDITNYYITIPSNNVETAFWLESDRMLGLSFNPEVLATQKNVVIEEFKQRYLNQPYGDAWHLLRGLAYQVHPYQWPTIGKELNHIEHCTMEDVKQFFSNYYQPANAILVVVGNISYDEVVRLTNKWFGPIESSNSIPSHISPEPAQETARFNQTEQNVQANAIYKAYHMSARTEVMFHAGDLLSDLLGRGRSSILYQNLVKDQQLFTSISSYVTGSIDPGLLVIHGKLRDEVSFGEASSALESITNSVEQYFDESDLEKVKNQAEVSHTFANVELLNRAFGLAYSTFMGNTNLINEELDTIRQVSLSDIHAQASLILDPKNCSTLHYKKTG